MKSLLSLPLLALVLFPATALHAQIAFGPAQAITGSDNIITDGTYFDALQTGTGKSSYTIGTNIFNDAVATLSYYPPPYTTQQYVSNQGDGKIDLSPSAVATDTDPIPPGRLGASGDGFNGTFTTGNATDNTTFSHVLQATAYNSSPELSDITLSGLTIGDLYEVQVFKADADVSRDTVINGGVSVGGITVGNSKELDGATYSIGLLTATSTSSTFTFGAGPDGTFGEVNDIVVRDLGAVPEPSTYAMMLGGLAVLGFCVRRKLTA